MNIELLKPDYIIYKWKLDEEQLHNWIRLDSTCPKNKANDCTINVASFLKLIDRDYAESTARYKNSMQIGTTTEELQEAIYGNIDSENSTWIKKTIVRVPFELNQQTFDLIRNKLGQGYLTAVNFYRPDFRRGHSAIMGVMPDNGLAIIDPQQQLIYYEKNGSIIHFIKYWKYLCLFFKNRADKRIRENSIIRNESHSIPLKRTRMSSRSPIPMEIDDL
jgi:hypothetical protein